VRAVKIRISGGDTDAPAVVRYSFWAWIVAGAIGLIDAVLFYTVKDALIDATIKQNPSLTIDQVRSGANNFLLLTLISAIVFAALYAYFAYRARDGKRSARTAVTVIGILHLLLALLFPVSYLVLFGVLLSIVGMVLLYLPTAKAYFSSQV
jgi:uncharacterized membrane protein YbhN (UPF0104 family)